MSCRVEGIYWNILKKHGNETTLFKLFIVLKKNNMNTIKKIIDYEKSIKKIINNTNSELLKILENNENKLILDKFLKT